MQGTLGLSRRPAVFSPDQCRFFSLQNLFNSKEYKG